MLVDLILILNIKFFQTKLKENKRKLNGYWYHCIKKYHFDTYKIFGVGRIEIWDFILVVLSMMAREQLKFLGFDF
jgi:hypothetical protein